jgi:hypothetical protein
MTERRQIMYRSQMKKDERESRSRLKPYVSYKAFVRGTLSVRQRVCGKPNCKCTRGQKHVCLVLTRSKHGKTEQLYIPKEKEQMVRQWVENYHALQGLLERISSVYWDRVKTKE